MSVLAEPSVVFTQGVATGGAHPSPSSSVHPGGSDGRAHPGGSHRAGSPIPILASVHPGVKRPGRPHPLPWDGLTRPHPHECNSLDSTVGVGSVSNSILPHLPFWGCCVLGPETLTLSSGWCIFPSRLPGKKKTLWGVVTLSGGVVAALVPVHKVIALALVPGVRLGHSRTRIFGKSLYRQNSEMILWVKHFCAREGLSLSASKEVGLSSPRSEDSDGWLCPPGSFISSRSGFATELRASDTEPRPDGPHLHRPLCGESPPSKSSGHPPAFHYPHGAGVNRETTKKKNERRRNVALDGPWQVTCFQAELGGWC